MIGTIGNRGLARRLLDASLNAGRHFAKPAVDEFKKARKGPQRQWSRNLFRIPFEFKGHFKTADGILYTRSTTTGVIRRAIPKVRGKKARAADKIDRMRARYEASHAAV